MNNNIYDTIIIGGGLSGMSCAYELKKSNYNSFLLLESSGRLGGRTETIHLKQFNGWVDFGGQWLGAGNPNLLKLIKDLNLKTYKQYYDGNTIVETDNLNFDRVDESKFSLNDFKIKNLNYFIKEIDSLISNINFNKQYHSIDNNNLNLKYFNSISLNKWLLNNKYKHLLNDKVILFFNWLSNMALASNSNDISLLFFLNYIHSIGSFEGMFLSNDQSSESDRVIGGSQEISNKIASIIGKSHYKLKQNVVAIDQTDKLIRVTTDLNFHYFCRNLITTIPPLLLRNVKFTPQLPKSKIDYLNNIQNGQVIKIIAIYKTQFWREKGYNGKVISFEGPIQEAFDNSTHDNQLKSIVGFIVGRDSVQHWSLKSIEERRHAVLKQYCKYWGNDALYPLYYNEKNWNLDQFTKGCFGSVCIPNQNMSTNGYQLSKSFGNIHFAGTETSNKWTSHMEGAIISSQRATKLIKERLTNSKL